MSRIMVPALAASLLSTALCGCSGGSQGLYPVYGKVTYRGEPATGAVVTFHPRDPGASNGQVPRGEVLEDGTFHLTCGDLGRGASPGTYAVLVEWRQGPLRTHRRDTARSAGKAVARYNKPVLMADDRLGGRYATLTRPRLTARVEPGTNNLPPFDLTD